MSTKKKPNKKINKFKPILHNEWLFRLFIISIFSGLIIWVISVLSIAGSTILGVSVPALKLAMILSSLLEILWGLTLLSLMFDCITAISSPQKLKTLPANTLSKLFKFLLPKKTFELFIETKIADEIQEYIEALDNKEFNKARYIKIRVWIVVLYSVALILPSRFVKVMQSIVKK